MRSACMCPYCCPVRIHGLLTPQMVLADDLDTPASLACLPSLQRCYLAGLHTHTQAALPLPAGPWLASVRCLGGNIGTLLASAALLHAASALEYIEVAGPAGLGIDWHSPAAAAFFGWLAAHPPLRRVLLCLMPDSSVFESWAFTILLAELWQRRPALRVDCIEFEDVGCHSAPTLLNLIAGKD